MAERHLVTEASEGYELLDSGDHEKLERWGDVVTARPDTQAIWTKQDAARWENASARYSSENGKGAWKTTGTIPEPWLVRMNDLTLSAKLSSIKHTGIFPEQAPNWDWATDRIASLQSPEVLNLFGYTGAASVSAAKAGAKVTHVDSSKAAITWTAENAKLSGLPDDALRLIGEDARSFVKRELKRGTKYDGIILDPPAFGRGGKGEVWKIEEDLLPLLQSLKELLSEKPGTFFLLNGYAAGYSPLSFKQLVDSVFGEVDADYGELRIKETSGRELPCGMYVRFAR